MSSNPSTSRTPAPRVLIVAASRFREFALCDGRRVTGQQQFSRAAAARLVVAARGR